METRNLRKERTGVVFSNKMDKTITVAVKWKEKHPIYGKFVNKTKKYHAHDEANQYNEGDLVEIEEVDCPDGFALRRLDDQPQLAGLGQVEPLDRIGTDPGRWLSYTREFAAAQNLLYAGYPWRFHRFRKTGGYASQPLDGIWARSPYLHNGSVPSLRALLLPPDQRPQRFMRGSDLIDPRNGGFGDDPNGHGWEYDTTRPGNGNGGHLWGTGLSPADRESLLSYLKTL